MPEATKATIIIEGDAKGAIQAFLQTGKAAEGLEKQTGILGTSLGKLGAYAVSFFAFYKVVDFFKSSTEEAMKANSAWKLTASNIERAGISYAKVGAEVEAFAKKMQSLGRSDEETALATSRLTVRTGDVNKAMKLTKLASDLAASGVGTYAENIDTMERVASGRGARSVRLLTGFYKENSTVLEQTTALQGRVTQTTDQWAKTTEGSIAVMYASWDELKEQIGNSFLIAMSNASTYLTQGLNNITDETMTWAEKMGVFLNVTLPSLWEGLPTVLERKVLNPLSKKLIEANKGKFDFLISDNWINHLKEQVAKYEGEQKKLDKSTQDRLERFKIQMKELKKLGGGDLGKFSGFDPLSAAAEELAKKTKVAFDKVSDTISSGVSDQIKEIESLRSKITDLGKEIKKQLEDEEKSYKKSVLDKAKSAKEKIEQIEKEIKETQEAGERGWRNKIAELEKERQKEQDIIDKSRGVVTNIQTELAKDEFTIMREAHEAKMAEIRREEKEKTDLFQEEITGRKIVVENAMKELLSPSYFKKLVEAQGKASSWQTTPAQQIFNFDFKGANIADVESFKKEIISSLNRYAVLKEFSGVSGK